MMWRFFSVLLVFSVLTACAGSMTASQIDSDGDGVIDGLDRCPDSAMNIAVDSDGCGIDSDLDGVFDYLDHCPGTAINVAVDINGCPLDSDGDGVADDQDRCAGTPAGYRVDARGCLKAVVKKAEQPVASPPPPAPQLELMILFRTGQAELLPGNEAELARGAEFIKRYPGARIVVEGHTDSVGPDAYNLSLSEQRAAKVSQELSTRLPGTAPDMTVKGYGETQPVADNETQSGREKNRRVVIRIQTGS